MNTLLKLALGSLLQNGLEKRKEMKMNINSAEFAGIVRAVVPALMAYLAGKNVIDNETAATIGAAITTIIVAVWSVLSKRKA
jgi:energy-converting hydrogenase Eha subunit B